MKNCIEYNNLKKYVFYFKINLVLNLYLYNTHTNTHTWKCNLLYSSKSSKGCKYYNLISIFTITNDNTFLKAKPFLSEVFVPVN